MNARFIQSWRGALLIAAIVTISVSGYKAVFGPDAATRIAQVRASNMLPGGQPTQEMFSRQVAAATPYVSARITLRQMTQYLEGLNYEISWEPVDVGVFVMRAGGTDPLTQQHEEFSVQFIALEGPTKNGRVVGSFNGPAIGIEGMAYNRAIMSEAEIVQFLLSVLSGVSPVPIQ